ncbi:MAG TPA: fused MFS/spermidine synthase, partial [Gemmataceae bacterium]|nr:fused MFS/spermidine synthase [Gemmataceae bacterium]
MRRGWLCALFFVSGASALVYELVWQRMLILIFGVSTLSVSAVLAAFMAGLALGGMVFGRLADRARRPLKLYAWLEAGIAVSGLLVPLAFRATQTIYPSLYNALQAGPWSGTLLRFGLSMLVLIVPATLIGGTLPVMGRLVMRRQETTSAAFSLLYAVNTLGAVAGAALTGFLALRYLGMQHTLWLAAALNMAVALSARFMSRNETEALGGAVRSGRSATESAPQSFMLVLAAVTGVTSMGFEVAWTRILGILTSNSAYGFALLLSVMLLGIGLGSLLQVWWSRRPGDNWSRLALCQWTLVAVTLVTLPFFRAAPAWFDRLCDGTSTVSIFAGELALTAWALLAPAMLMGLSLPLLVAGTVREPGSYGNKLGRLYAVNTLGCVLGAFLTGFVLIPRLGIHATVGVILGATLSVGVIAWERAAALTYRLR